MGRLVESTTLEDSAYTFAAADFGFTDPNDSPANNLLAVRITTIPGAGSLTLSGVAVSAGQSISAANIAAGNLQFTPAADASGAGYASFTFQVQDDGGIAIGGVDLDASANTMTVNVTAVNDAPAGTNNTVTTLEDTAYTFAAADFGFSDANDTPANNLSAVKITTIPGTGGLTLSGIGVSPGQSISVANIAAGNLQFTPAANGNGAAYASFTFQVQDDGGTANGGVDLDASPATMTIDVTAVNDAPVIGQNTLTLTQGGTVQMSAAQLSATDVDNPAAGLLFTVSAVTHGQFELSTAPAVPILTFTQAQIAAGQVLFAHDATTSAPTYDISVSDGSLSAGPAPATISFNVSSVAIAPTAAPLAVPTPPVFVVPPTTSSDATPPAPVPAIVTSGPADSVSDGAVSSGDGGGADGDGEGGSGGGGGGGRGTGGGARASGAQTASPLNRFGVITETRTIKPIRADLRELSLVRTGSATIEAPSAAAADLGLLISGSEAIVKFQGSAQTDWSITSVYNDNSATEHKEQISILLDSAEFAGVALSVGVVWWASRLTGVVGSLLASMPAWRHLDPLPVVGMDDTEEATWDDESGDLDADADELAVSMVLEGPGAASSMPA
jgi:hypothetical protein